MKHPLLRSKRTGGYSVAAISGAETGEAGGLSDASTVVSEQLLASAGFESGGGTAGGGVMQYLQSNDGITVQGYGSATVDAERAILDIQLSRDPNAPQDTPRPGGPFPSPRPPNEAEIQPLINALVQAGVPAENIQFTVQTYFGQDPTAQSFRVIVSDLSLLSRIVETAYQTAENSVLFLGQISVVYTLNDCTALEEAAMRAAVADANERAAVLARTLAVGLGGVTGASHYSNFPSTPCESSNSLPGHFGSGGVQYVEGQPRQVQIIANVAVTFAIAGGNPPP
jgi:uncharacterized protein YggE